MENVFVFLLVFEYILKVKVLVVQWTLQYLAFEKSRLSPEILEFVNITKKFNMQFPTQAIHNSEHFRYNQVPKTKVSETRTNRSSTVRDPDHCSAHGLTENFILLNSRLNEISVESKNA